jgi:hypothetical protein
MHLAMPGSSLRSRPRRGQRAGQRGRVDRADEPPLPHGRHRRIIRSAPIVRVPCRRPDSRRRGYNGWGTFVLPDVALIRPPSAGRADERLIPPEKRPEIRMQPADPVKFGEVVESPGNHAHNDVGIRGRRGAAEWAFVAPLPVSNGGDSAGDLPAPALVARRGSRQEFDRLRGMAVGVLFQAKERGPC